jgi:exodeoxyribonuclease V alpha subunit
LGKFQLLCSTNLQVDRANAEGIRALKTNNSAPQGLPHGCPLLILSNHPPADLSNGDIGIALGSHHGGPADLALFPSSAGQARLLPIAQLPAHAPAFGLTIHKSQGSEWESVVIELPPDPHSALLTKNLIYTAITRSSRSIHLYGTPPVLQSLLAQR